MFEQKLHFARFTANKDERKRNDRNSRALRRDGERLL